jgi:imidazole glycerol-phosphate synthase subunit HisH
VSAPRVAIVDYGMGNLRSVEKAIEHVGGVPEITSEHARIREADGIVLPGVGAFPKAMAAVRRLALESLLRELAGAGRPVLGICLGVQLLFERSTELGGAEGIGLLKGGVDSLEAEGLKLPQIGWNPVSWRRAEPLTAGLSDPCAFYHVHTYAPRPAHAEDVLGTAEYGAEFVTAVGRGNIHGVQFHPEKSGPDGLRLLGNFVRSCVPVPA